MVDLPSVDAGVLEELLQALLEVAARKDALRAWPRAQPPDLHPPVQARRDEDGTLGVFRFFTIVAAETRPDPVRELTADEARARIEGIEEHLHAGDEVGVELPLGRLAAIALADVEATRDAIDPQRAHGRDARLLPQRIVEMLGDSALAAAVAARLSSLRGPPPHVPLRRLVTDHGGDVVEWTAVCGDAPVIDDDEEPDDVRADQRGELIVLVSRGGEHRLVVVPTATSSAGHAALLRALAPQPVDKSLWRYLEVHGPALLCGDTLWSEEGPPGETARRLSLEVKSIAISRDPTVYGVARAKARLLTWSGDKIVDEVDATIGLPVDLPRLVSEPWPEGEALERVHAAAASFRESLQRRLSALVDARQPTVPDVLGGAAFLRVLARAAAGDPATFPFAELSSSSSSSVAEPIELREIAEPPAAWPEDEINLRLADVGVLVLSPADDVVKLRVLSPNSAGISAERAAAGEDVLELFVDGALVDGDVEGWRAFTDVFAQAISDAGVDVELAFPVEDGDDDEVETVMLSAWLLALGDTAAPSVSASVSASVPASASTAGAPGSASVADDAADVSDGARERPSAPASSASGASSASSRSLRWPPRARAAESAQALHLLLDRFVDAGPDVRSKDRR